MDPPAAAKTPPFDFSNIPDPSVEFFKDQRRKKIYADSLYEETPSSNLDDTSTLSNANPVPSESTSDFGSSLNKLISELPLSSELNHPLKSSSTLTNVDGTPLSPFEADMVSRFRIMHEQALKKEASDKSPSSMAKDPIMEINVINKIHPSKRDLVKELKDRLDSQRSSNLVHSWTRLFRPLKIDLRFVEANGVYLADIKLFEFCPFIKDLRFSE
jgi:hypothetical protein